MLRVGNARVISMDSTAEIAAREGISVGYVDSLMKEYRSLPKYDAYDLAIGTHESAAGHNRMFEARGARGLTLAQANFEFLRLLHLEMLDTVRARNIRAWRSGDAV